MRIRTALTAMAAAAAVAATPLAAAQARTSMPVESESELGGSAFVGIGIFVAIVAAVYFIADANDADENDEPVSP